MPSGGWHPPSNPAAVSGPGALSRRTDSKQPAMKLSDPKYGEQQDFQQIQQGAPMQAPASAVPPPSQMPPAVPPPTPINAPSNQPNVPVTSGAAAGPGPGPQALNLPQQPNDSRQALAQMYLPILPALLAESQGQYATQAYKNAVAALTAIL